MRWRWEERQWSYFRSGCLWAPGTGSREALPKIVVPARGKEAGTLIHYPVQFTGAALVLEE